MIAWELPVSLDVGGSAWDIRYDFRAILDILRYFNDPNYEQDEKWLICLDILYKDFSVMPSQFWQEAGEKAVDFIDMGIKDDGRPKPHLMDWEQDAPIIIPAVNKVIGRDVRSYPKGEMHWWTFLSAYMEIGDSLFSQVTSIRQKKAKHQKLDKQEQKWYQENKNLVDLKQKYTEEELKQQQRMMKWLD